MILQRKALLTPKEKDDSLYLFINTAQLIFIDGIMPKILSNSVTFLKKLISSLLIL
jgi:hypothetical protein